MLNCGFLATTGCSQHLMIMFAKDYGCCESNCLVVGRVLTSRNLVLQRMRVHTISPSLHHKRVCYRRSQMPLPVYRVLRSLDYWRAAITSFCDRQEATRSVQSL